MIDKEEVLFDMFVDVRIPENENIVLLSTF
jgi:hypothetical protein